MRSSDPGPPPVQLATLSQKKRLWWRHAIVNILLIGFWFFFSTLLSLYNKWILSDLYYGFTYPFFMTTLHVFVQFAMAAFLRAVWPKRFRSPHSPDEGRLWVSRKKAVPTAVATSLDIGLSNMSLGMISLPLFAMTKSSSLIFVLLFAFLFRLEKVSLRLICVIFLIFSGVLLMVTGTKTPFELGGFLLVLSASGLGGFRYALTQILLKNKKMGMDNPVAAIYWLAPVTGLTLATIGLIMDDWFALVLNSPFFAGRKAAQTLFFLTLPGMFSFCVVLTEYSIIQRAGVVSTSVAGIAKEVASISVSAAIFGYNRRPPNATGLGITVCGIALFTYHKYRNFLKTDVALDDHGNPILIEDTVDGAVDGRIPSQDAINPSVEE
ncbi:triose-phosphate transporter family-domain-containing protein [Mycena haematopus]|nr:triose-phosphate transporter family-domain-containing protein [Mycena haematopus]